MNEYFCPCPTQLPNLPATSTDVVVTGDDEGIFGVEAGFLYALKPLDREKQPSYSLQVDSHTFMALSKHVGICLQYI